MTETSDISIRQATAADAGQLARLRFRFRAELGEPEENESDFAGRVAAWLAPRLGGERAPGWLAWVAADGRGTIRGHVFLQLIEKIPNPVAEPEWLAYLTNFYVEPALRGCGLGGRLLRAALAECDRRAVDLTILQPSRASVPLYLRHGFGAAGGLLARPGEKQ